MSAASAKCRKRKAINDPEVRPDLAKYSNSHLLPIRTFGRTSAFAELLPISSAHVFTSAFLLLCWSLEVVNAVLGSPWVWFSWVVCIAVEGTPAGLDPAAQRRRALDPTPFEQLENIENPLRCPVKLYEFYLSKWWVLSFKSICQCWAHWLNSRKELSTFIKWCIRNGH